MIIFPPEFVKLRYPGYYWNTLTKELYSIKVSGKLHKLTVTKTRLVRGVLHPEGYRISVKGQRILLPLTYLNVQRFTSKTQIVDVDD